MDRDTLDRILVFIAFIVIMSGVVFSTGHDPYLSVRTGVTITFIGTALWLFSIIFVRKRP